MKSERESWAKVLSDTKTNRPSEPVAGAQSVWKSLSVLQIISDSEKPYSFVELQKISALPKGTLHRILQALTEFQLVRIDESNNSYHLGSKLFEMAHKVWNRFDLRGSADPELARLVSISNETAQLVAFDGVKPLIIGEKKIDDVIQINLSIGRGLSLHGSAAGKVILAHLDQMELNKLIGDDNLESLTRNTINSISELKSQLNLVKARGYAISEEEDFEGVSSVAAPIIDSNGKPLGAISIIASTHRLPVDVLHNFGREVIESARRTSGNIGENYMSITKIIRPSVDVTEGVTCVLPEKAFLGESPHWNSEDGTIEWVDILEPSVHKFDIATKVDRKTMLSEIVGVTVPRKSGGNIAATQNGFRRIDIATGVITPLASVKNIDGCRFNDGKCDARGRFWAGTLSIDALPKKGALFRLDENHNVSRILDGLHIANGIGWNKEYTKMYLADSGERVIYAMDYDLENGTVSNKIVFIKFDSDDGTPDGLAIDEEGGLWVAIWDGWKVIRYDKNGVITRVINLPVPRPTSCTFGGTDMKTLYITSARIRLSAEALAQAPFSGSLFAIDVDIKGVESNSFGG
ncbi:SMP-30/gluconolactonase/LRE family protein [SAR92 clade bacterium H921]|jgi:sugar lactone lactonase YvrE/DNA-binding IclR family transcriptional regulator|nr:SMP-30/gluconolactonase/LRE family protein [SAR92 clade bacterium H921]